MNFEFPTESDDRRNILDKFKGLSDDQIKETLKPNRLNFSLLMENDIKDISRAGLVRNLNAFSGQRCIVYGQKRRINRRGAQEPINMKIFTMLKILMN